MGILSKQPFRAGCAAGAVKPLLLQAVACGLLAVVLPSLSAAQQAAFGPGLTRGRVVEVVPVTAIVDGDVEPAPSWAWGFADYAQRFWDRTSGGRSDLRFRTAEPVEWRRCADCRLDPFDPAALRPWIVQLDVRYRRSTDPPDAYLLIAAPGAVSGAGFYLPGRWLIAETGALGYDLLVATGPQAALHEIGHFLGFPDWYDPHSDRNERALTLMGWIADPVAPLDPVLRVRRGWAEVRDVQPTESRPERRTIYPEDVLRVPFASGGVWFGLQPLPGVVDDEGWMFEIDWYGRDGTFERLYEVLIGPDEARLGEVPLTVEGGALTVEWRFIPDQPRVTMTLRWRPPDLVQQPPSGGCAAGTAAPDGAVWWAAALLVLLGWRRARV
ncbi:MAG: hypothetical protein D6761_12720 [Candidatus Dadabacteria bacterium]|nr:MAG: hypothetical protein D6761_12720 [Candidatus Dadabacteria bacterium]